MVNSRIPVRGPRTLTAAVALMTAAMLIPTGSVAAAEPTDMVAQWNRIALAAIGNANTASPPGLGQAPPLQNIQLAIVHTAMYDAVNAIEPTHAPYLAGLSAPATASQNAAVATAAHHVLVGFTPESLPLVKADLDAKYGQSLADIPDGQAEDDGITVGAAAAAAMLQLRTGDGRFGSRTFVVGTEPGEWRPVPPLSNNVFAWVSDVRPFALRRAGQYLTEGPPDLASEQYAAEFNEVKTLGRAGAPLTSDQAALAAFTSNNLNGPVSRALGDIAADRGLSIHEQARLFALANVAAADAVIDCWYNKVHWSFWRPQTAIQLADTDGNDATTADTSWTSRIPAPGYTDNPSGYNCIAASMMHSARLFFGTDKVEFTLNNPASSPPTSRSYTRLTDFIDDAVYGRMLIGLHFRSADEQAAWLGKKVAQYVERNYFTPLD